MMMQRLGILLTLICIFGVMLVSCDKSKDEPTQHAYVDLGLSVKWATMNVGATKVEEYGDYFAWGETSAKTDYSWNTYKYCTGNSKYMTKYCLSSDYGVVDNKTTLDMNDDAASVNWGGSWRMPTVLEWIELYENCLWTWTTLNGVNGYLVSSKAPNNSNSIFIPAAGFRDSIFYGNVGSYGYYWCPSLHESYSNYAHYINFDTGDIYKHYYYRCYGRPIRAVCP